MADTDHAESIPVPPSPAVPADAATATGGVPDAASAAPQPADAAPAAPAAAAPQPADPAPPAAEPAAPAESEPARPPADPPAPIAAPASLLARLGRVQGLLAGEPTAAPLLSIVVRAHGLAQGEGLDEGTVQMLRLGLKAARRNSHLSDEVRGELQALAGALP